MRKIQRQAARLILFGILVFLYAAVAYSADGGMPELAGLADRLAAEIRDAGFEKIAVCARFQLVLDRSEQLRMAAFVEPADQSFADATRLTLLTALRRNDRLGQKPTLLASVRDIDATSRLQVGDSEAIKSAAQRINADAIVFGRLQQREAPPADDAAAWPLNLMLECQIADGKTGEVVASVVEELHPSLSNAAFFGDSFEVRRWRQGELLNVGFHDTASRFKWFEAVDHLPRGKYADICRARIHPLSNPEYPFKVSVRVKEQDRPLHFINRYAYVALDAGEVYSVHMENHCGSEVFVALFVDGVNVRNKVVELPSNCRCWHLDRGSEANFRGYYSERGREFMLEPFTIGSPEDSPAVAQGRLSSLGQITAVFFTVGVPQLSSRTEKAVAQIRVARPAERIRLPNGQMAHAEPADDVQDRLVTIAGPPRFVARGADRVATAGLVLSTVTIRYGSQSKIEQLAMSSGNGDLNSLTSDNGYLNCDYASRSRWPTRTAADRTGVSVRDHILRGHPCVIASRVQRDSPASYLYRGAAQRFEIVADRDVITHVNGVEVTNVKVFDQLILQAGSKCDLTIFDLEERRSAEYAIWLW
jgi:hypothetical protein